VKRSIARIITTSSAVAEAARCFVSVVSLNKITRAESFIIVPWVSD